MAAKTSMAVSDADAISLVAMHSFDQLREQGLLAPRQEILVRHFHF